MPDIFVSYARENCEQAQILADVLTKQGWNVWWDTGIRHGQNYRTRIREALDQARCILVVWPRHSVHSDWVLDEG